MNIEELQKCSIDPIYFIETYVKIQHPVHGAIPFILHPFQRNYIEEIHSGSVIAAFGRQMGKTMLIAAYLLWANLFKQDSHRSLIISKTLPQATEVMTRIKFMFEELPGWMKPSAVRMNRNEIQFESGSMIKIAAANQFAGRGQTLDLVVFEEFAFWSKTQQEEVLLSMLPIIATDGKLIVASTLANSDPKSENKFNVMYESARAGNTKMKALRYSWTDHPERNEMWASQMVEMLGEERFKSEFEVNLETI